MAGRNGAQRKARPKASALVTAACPVWPGGARFAQVIARPRCLLGCCCFGLAAVASCAVFPDRAILPTPPDSAGTGGGGIGVDEGGAGGSSGSALAGAGATGAQGGADGPALGGQAGGGGATCTNPEQLVVPVSADSWIDAGDRAASHDIGPLLSVVGGAGEKRALLKLTVPVAPAGGLLRKASFELYLMANADPGLGERRLGMHQIKRDLGNASVSWDNYGNGASRKWDTPGGDFGVELARALVPAATSERLLRFDLTLRIQNIQSSVATPISLIVLESGSVPRLPAELTFASIEGSPTQRPRLVLDYCDP